MDLKSILKIAVLALLANGAQAQNYPTKPVTMVVPFSAGGPTDTLGRTIAQAMTVDLKQTVMIENVGGAGGTRRGRRLQPQFFSFPVRPSTADIARSTA